jgi:hypothetical protein
MRPPLKSFFAEYPFPIRCVNDRDPHGWLQDEFRSADRSAALRERDRVADHNRRLAAQQSGDASALPVINEHLSPVPLGDVRPMPLPEVPAAITHLDVCDRFCDRIEEELRHTRVHIRDPVLFRSDIRRLFYILSYSSSEL